MAKKTTSKKKAAAKLAARETIVGRIPDSAKHIEDIGDDALQRALKLPVRAVEEEPEIEVVEEPKTPKKVKSKKKPKQELEEAYEEISKFDREALLTLYEKDQATAQELFLQLISKNLAYSSAIAVLQSDLDLDPQLRSIRVKAMENQIRPIISYYNYKMLCETLGLDFNHFMEYHLRNQELQRLDNNRARNNGKTV